MITHNVHKHLMKYSRVFFSQNNVVNYFLLFCVILYFVCFIKFEYLDMTRDHSEWTVFLNFQLKYLIYSSPNYYWKSSWSCNSNSSHTFKWNVLKCPDMVIPKLKRSQKETNEIGWSMTEWLVHVVPGWRYLCVSVVTFFQSVTGSSATCLTRDVLAILSYSDCVLSWEPRPAYHCW